MLKSLKDHPLRWALKGAMIAFLIVLTVFVIFQTRNTIRKYGYIGRAPLSQYTINIQGEGKVLSVPDVAVINLGVTSEAKSVKQAQNDNTQKMNAVIKAVKSFNVDEKDIQTTNYNLRPKYSYDRESGISDIVGYTVSQSIRVKMRNLDEVGSLLAATASAGANQAGGVSFSVDKPEELKSQARQKAIKDARDKAEALAKELGAKLGRVVSFNEYDNGKNYPVRAYAEGLGAGGGPAPDIEPGSQEIMANVNIVFEIK